MKKIAKLTSLILFLFIISETNGQAKPKRPSSQIEIMSFKKWDSYPEFRYSINSINTNTIKIDGASWGIMAFYKYPIKNTLYLKGGVGYYQYSFDRINSKNRFGTSNARIIYYPSPIEVIFTSNKYWYNTFVTTIGMEKWIKIFNTLYINGYINFNNFYTFSQNYRITTDFPTGPPGHSYKQYNKRNFGFSVISSVGILKSYGGISLGPFVSVPIYDVWHKDPIFPSEIPRITENLSSTRDKWFKGIGAGISLNYSLK